MKAYKIFNYERDVLIRQHKEFDGKYSPIRDINGDWFISKEEHDYCGLGNLEEYIPPIVEDI